MEHADPAQAGLTRAARVTPGSDKESGVPRRSPGAWTLAPTHTITVAQAAEALGVSERTVWRYLKSGRLAGETVGEPGAQRTLIPREAVDALTGARAARTPRPCAPSATAWWPSWPPPARSATRSRAGSPCCSGRCGAAAPGPRRARADPRDGRPRPRRGPRTYSLR